MPFGNEHCKEIEELTCPYCHEKLIMNKRQYANHIRWCKANPKYQEIKDKTLQKINEHCKNKHDLLFHDHTFTCVVCGKEYVLNISDKNFLDGKYRKTCCNKCAKKLTAVNTNTTLKNQKISETLTQIAKQNNCETERLLENGQTCLNCGTIFYSKRKKKFCSKQCKNAYTKKLNAKGKDFWKIYRSQCAFTFNLKDFPEEFDFESIKKFGWYTAFNRGDNVNGVSRDHMLSCKEGYELLIDPYLISHPANCELIQQSKNASKSIKSSLTLEQLIERVKKWNAKYGTYPNKIVYDIIPEVAKIEI